VTILYRIPNNDSENFSNFAFLAELYMHGSPNARGWHVTPSLVVLLILVIVTLLLLPWEEEANNTFETLLSPDVKLFKREQNQKVSSPPTASPQQQQQQQTHPDDCIENRMSLVVLCDRGPDDSGPLVGLVNSFLASSSWCIKLHYISRYPFAWLEDLQRPPIFQVERHDPAHILEPRAQQLLETTGYHTTHYSGRFAMQKLFIPLLNFSEQPDTILVIDDDMVFYEDVAKLWQIIVFNNNTPADTTTMQASLPLFTFYCPEDPDRVKAYFIDSNRKNNGDSKRFCNSGIIGVDVHSQYVKTLAVQVFENATNDLMQEYPDFVSTTADQDIVNRVVAGYPQFVHNTDQIPCEWNCDYNSCGKTLQDPNGFHCTNCHRGTLTDCYAFHFNVHSWKTDAGSNNYFQPRMNSSLTWLYYSRLNSTKLLLDMEDKLLRPLRNNDNDDMLQPSVRDEP
jgi:lipopolysaccharide biosynthesis glycosyltransferase